MLCSKSQCWCRTCRRHVWPRALLIPTVTPWGSGDIILLLLLDFIIHTLFHLINEETDGPQENLKPKLEPKESESWAHTISLLFYPASSFLSTSISDDEVSQDQAQHQTGVYTQNTTTLDGWIAIQGYTRCYNSFLQESELSRGTESCDSLWKCVGDRRWKQKMVSVFWVLKFGSHPDISPSSHLQGQDPAS